MSPFEWWLEFQWRNGLRGDRIAQLHVAAFFVAVVTVLSWLALHVWRLGAAVGGLWAVWAAEHPATADALRWQFLAALLWVLGWECGVLLYRLGTGYYRTPSGRR